MDFQFLWNCSIVGIQMLSIHCGNSFWLHALYDKPVSIPSQPASHTKSRESFWINRHSSAWRRQEARRSFQKTGCYSLHLECPVKFHMLKAWSPGCGTIGMLWNISQVGSHWRKLGHGESLLEGNTGTLTSSFLFFPAAMGE
jgi:hypothetical protein